MISEPSITPCALLPYALQISSIVVISKGCDNFVLMFDLTCGHKIILIAVIHMNYASIMNFASCICASCERVVVLDVNGAIAVLYTQVMALFQSCFKV